MDEVVGNPLVGVGRLEGWMEVEGGRQKEKNEVKQENHMAPQFGSDRGALGVLYKPWN